MSKVLSLEKPLIVGRASSKDDDRAPKLNNLYIRNLHLSKSHARLWIENNVVYLADAGSTFGTTWNGRLLIPHRKVALAHGDQIGFVVSRPSYKLSELYESHKSQTDKAWISLNHLPAPKVQLQFNVDTIEGKTITVLAANDLTAEYCADIENGNALVYGEGTPDFKTDDDEPPEIDRIVKESCGGKTAGFSSPELGVTILYGENSNPPDCEPLHALYDEHDDEHDESFVESENSEVHSDLGSCHSDLHSDHSLDEDIEVINEEVVVYRKGLADCEIPSNYRVVLLDATKVLGLVLDVVFDSDESDSFYVCEDQAEDEEFDENEEDEDVDALSESEKEEFITQKIMLLEPVLQDCAVPYREFFSAEFDSQEEDDSFEYDAEADALERTGEFWSSEDDDGALTPSSCEEYLVQGTHTCRGTKRKFEDDEDDGAAAEPPKKAKLAKVSTFLGTVAKEAARGVFWAGVTLTLLGVYGSYLTLA